MLIVRPSRIIARSPLLYALTLLPDCRSAYSYTSPRDPLTHPGRREERREGKWDVQITKAVVIEERPHVLSGDVGAGRCPRCNTQRANCKYGTLSGLPAMHEGRISMDGREAGTMRHCHKLTTC